MTITIRSCHSFVIFRCDEIKKVANLFFIASTVPPTPKPSFGSFLPSILLPVAVAAAAVWCSCDGRTCSDLSLARPSRRGEWSSSRCPRPSSALRGRPNAGRSLNTQDAWQTCEKTVLTINTKSLSGISLHNDLKGGFKKSYPNLANPFPSLNRGLSRNCQKRRVQLSTPVQDSNFKLLKIPHKRIENWNN